MKTVYINTNEGAASLTVTHQPPMSLAERAYEKLANGSGICHFAFKKKDGSLREAFGTLHPDWFTDRGIEEKKPGGDKEPNPDIQVYFDLEANAWRSFVKSNIVAVY